MPRPELHHTLVAAVKAVSPPVASSLVVTAVDLDLPLELSAGARDGNPVIGGTVPHSRWTTGFLPDVHLAHLRIELVEPTGPSAHGR